MAKDKQIGFTMLSLWLFVNLIMLQILEQRIMAVLPTLKSHINSQLVAVAKEHATYGEFEESKVCICLFGGPCSMDLSFKNL